LSFADGVSFQQMGDGEGGVVLKAGTGQLFTCNDTTSVFLAALDGRRTFAELMQAVLDQFEVNEDELRDDLKALASELHEKGIVRVQ